MPIGVPYNFEEMQSGELDAVANANSVDNTPTENEVIPEQPVENSEQVIEQNQPTANVETEQPNPTETEQPTENNETTDLKDEQILAFLNKKNGTSFENLEEYQSSLTKEVEKKVEITPEYDEETQRFLDFKKDTNRGMADWIKLNEDHDKKSDKQLALEKIKEENTGIDLSKEDLNILLAEKLGVDVEDLSDLDHKDELRLKVIANSFKKELKAEQQKYLNPIEGNVAPEAEQAKQPSGDMVTVNGQQIPKQEYLKLREEYLTERNTQVSGLKSASFDLEIGSGAGKQTVAFNYNYTEPDRKQMLSSTETLDNFLDPYVADGKLNHKQLNEDMWWSNSQNREKAIKALLQQARSGGVDEVLKEERNIDFSKTPKPIQQKKNNGYGEVGTSNQGGLSVKFPFNP